MNHQRTILSQTNLSSLLSCALCSLSLLSESEPLLAMGEPLLAAYLQSLLDKLAPGPLMNFAIQQGFGSELRKWRSMLRKTKPVLGDAEEKQMSDIEVKRWLDDLLVLAYDADDALDDLDCEALQQQNSSSSDPATSCSQLLDMLPLIKKITARFQDTEEQKSDLGLEAKHGVRSRIINKRLETTSLLDTSEIVGREQDVEAILKLMGLSETTKAEAHENPACGMGGWKPKGSLHMEAPMSETIVIPIVGPGGVGKTTLAKCIYNHKKVENWFKLKVWACVSDTFDILGVTKVILEQVDRNAKDVNTLNTLNALQERLKEKISWQSFPIVLDDIWTEDYEEWKNLIIPFKEGRMRSFVIVTTRSEKVAKKTGTTSPYHLDLLKHDECVSIFAQHALRAKDFSDHQDLKGIGEKIVRRCNGLPLAAATLGGLLRNEDPMKWKEVYDSSLWNNSISKKIIPALALSYHYLPSKLKQCFAYFSVFPKDHEFDEEELILLWMAEGFLVEPKGHKQMEDLGHEYFRELLSRSLLQKPRYPWSRKFVMHDLIHDLAQIVAGRVCFRMEDNKAEDVDIEVVCHLSSGLEPNKFEVLKNTKRLRTLLALLTQKNDDSHSMNEKLLHNLLPQLRYLRVLSLSFCQISEIPSTVGDLKYVRYLNFSYTSIKFLPESLYDLHFLQYLILKGCAKLQQLPLRSKELANLRYLDISGTKVQQELPPHLLDLKFFPKLTRFVVARFWGVAGKYLLPGGLMISILDEVKDDKYQLVIDLMNKKNIEELEFDCSKTLDNNENAKSQVQILNLLEPRNLVIRGYGGVTLPNWIGNSSYSKLVELSLIDCKRCKSMPSLGQLPLLQKLTIKGMLEIEIIGTELYGAASPDGQPFPSLTELYIENCKNVRTLPDAIMSSNSKLQVLEIRDCRSLESFGSGVLPQPFPSLTKLCIERCKNLRTLPDGIMRSNSNLQVLEIRNCESLESFGSGVLPQTFPSLTELRIYDCKNLRTLPDGIMSSNSNLQVLEIMYCGSLESFGSGVLPSTLKKLSIWYCGKLESISEIPNNLQKLTSLCVVGCDNLVSLPEGGLPPGLQDFKFGACAKLEKQMWDEWAPHKLPFLTHLCIHGVGCEGIESFPFLETPNLAHLEISYCLNLKYLPSNLPKLTSLLYLCVVGCDNLVSLPEGGLPPSLQRLFFGPCAKVEKQMRDEWAPHKLSSLTSLSLIGGFRDVESQFLLPPGLTSLSIYDSNWESLSSSAFRNLQSLGELFFLNCPKLRSLPVEALPPSLRSLNIGECPELTPKCKKGGEYWPRLSLIPDVWIDYLPLRLRDR